MVALGIIGFLAFIVCIILLIWSAIKKKTKRYWAIGIGISFILFIVGMASSSTPTSTPTSIPAPTPAPTTIQVTAQELYSAYKANEVAADTKYKGKILKVTGVVLEIGKDIFGTPYVTLSSGEKYEVWGVQCTFSLKDEPQLAQLTKGQTITVQGKGKGYLINVLMGDGVLVP